MVSTTDGDLEDEDASSSTRRTGPDTSRASTSTSGSPTRTATRPQRSYSIASAPEDDQLALTVERLDDGEVSPYLVDELRAGDELELRGPIGGYFVWRDSDGGPLQLLAGGSGIVPLRAMLRHRAAAGSSASARLLYSARSLDDVIYRDELMEQPDGVEVAFALTRSWPEELGRPPGPGRQRAPRRSRLAAGDESARLHLRPDRLRRGCSRAPSSSSGTIRGGSRPSASERRADELEASTGTRWPGCSEEVFGLEATTAATVCAACSASRPLAELVVFRDGPGTIIRCRSCTSLLMAVVTIRGRSCVDLTGLSAFELAP